MANPNPSLPLGTPLHTDQDAQRQVKRALQQEAKIEYRAWWTHFLLGRGSNGPKDENGMVYPSTEVAARLDELQAQIGNRTGAAWVQFTATLPGYSVYWQRAYGILQRGVQRGAR